MPRHPSDSEVYVLRITRSPRKDGGERMHMTPPKRIDDSLKESGEPFGIATTIMTRSAWIVIMSDEGDLP